MGSAVPLGLAWRAWCGRRRAVGMALHGRRCAVVIGGESVLWVALCRGIGGEASRAELE